MPSLWQIACVVKTRLQLIPSRDFVILIIINRNRKYKDYVYGRCLYMSTWKNKEYFRNKGKARKWYDVSRHIWSHMSKYKKNEDILSSMSNLQPNWCLKIDLQKVDQHAGGKWLIHNTKRRRDNHLQSLKLPCRIRLLNFFIRSGWIFQDQICLFHCRHNKNCKYIL